ncbi:M16 family metallopeptidase [Sphingobacterium sp. UDSM-2020]|uniref:M16 family metallopeptidase n=1 Tax=Sphingobacterium sp. UDSM-2020 TaxID=2795738 RepID=UPI001934E983|nr:pitrilysin family protein [Sphingobacterium sp. UDSM-2020]QQD12582.1 insulinase family protein [Sphingobacterium sp. UDSM-2020]
MLNRAVAPEAKPIGDIHLKSPKVLAFNNGIPVYVFHSPDQELVRIEWIFNNVFNEDENPLLNSALSALLKEGTKNYNSAEIADKVDFYGAFLMPEYGFDITSLTLYTLNKHSNVLLPLIKEILTESVLPQKELDTYLRNNKQKLQVSLQKNDYLARRTYYNHVFGSGNRYGKTPSLEEYDLISRDALIDLYHKQFTPSNCRLIISGNVSESLLQELSLYFGDQWLATDEVPLTEPNLTADIGQLIYDERAEALQSAIRIGMPNINRNHVDYPALQFVNTLLGGFFGSRLMRNIREEKGYTYSIGSAVGSLKYGGFLTIATEVGVDVTDATLTEIEKEIEILRTELATVEELDLVKNYLSGSMLGSLESIFSHADKFKNVLLANMDLTYYDHYMNEINAMTPEKVKKIAIQYFDYSKMIKIVVGKMKTLELVSEL